MDVEPTTHDNIKNKNDKINNTEGHPKENGTHEVAREENKVAHESPKENVEETS